MTSPPANIIEVSFKHAEPNPAFLQVQRYGATLRVMGYTLAEDTQHTVFTFDVSPSIVPGVKEMVGKALKGQQGVLTLVGWNVTLSSGLTQSLRAPLPQLTITYGDRQDSWQLQDGDIESEVSPERVVHLCEVSAFLALL